MSRMEVSSRPTHLPNDAAYGSHRNIPILPSSTASGDEQQSEAMDITPPSSAKMPPPKNTSPETEQDVSPTNSNGHHKWPPGQSRKDGDKSMHEGQSGSNGAGSASNVNAAVAAQAQQPKVVQTAFIHKLYNMLEDQNISHLICWSSSGESFVMAPSHEFSKVLSQYFKHTNISSFVRQLNMYGFHKVSDVFHTAGSETMWEFKHGNGSFKRGDTASLRDIKRRASRHSLISRDSFQQPAQRHAVPPPPGAPAEASTDPDHRITSLEYSLQDMHSRLNRVEDSNSHLSARCAWLSESLSKHQQWNNELCQIVVRLTSDRDGQLYRDVSNLQRDVAASQHDPYESRQHHQYLPPASMDPVSPRQTTLDDRRGSLSSNNNHSPWRPSFSRPPLPHTALSPRRYGSVSGSTAGYPASSSGYSPTTPTTSTSRPPLSGPQYTHPGLPSSHAPHPLSSVAEPGQGSNPGNLARRHTSADIRASEGWQQAQAAHAHAHGATTPVPPLPPPSGPPSSHWPSSPVPPHQQHPPHSAHDQSAQELRNTLNSFEFGRRATIHSRPNSPPAPDRELPPAPPPPLPPPITGPFASHENGGSGGGGWGFGGPSSSSSERPRAHAHRFADAQSAPPTRRSSLVSGGLQSLLNPADTAERMEEEEDGPEERKRKRLA